MKEKRVRFLGTLKSTSSITTLKQGMLFPMKTHAINTLKTPTLTTHEIKSEETCNNASIGSERGPERGSERGSERNKNPSSLVDLEDKCPPGGRDTVILYTTSLRGVRKTFRDCNTVRFLLGSFCVLYDERDVSMHMEFREELWQALGGRVIPPRLFIRGRHVGGVDEVVGFHEEGRLEELLNGIPKREAGGPCEGCGGLRFVLCSSCNGSRKVVLEEVGESDPPLPIRCGRCNENGLVKCGVCF